MTENVTTKTQYHVVIGGLGFIGTNLVNALLDRKAHNIVVIDDRSAESAIWGTKAHAALLDQWTMEGVVSTTWNAFKSQATKMADCDVTIYNLAACRKTMSDDTKRLWATNVLFAEDVAYWASKLGACLVHFSSGSVCDEAGNLRPVSPYGVSKLAGEYAVMKHRVNTPTLIVRPFNVYGKWQDFGPRGGVIARWAYALTHGQDIDIVDGTQLRAFTAVDALVDEVLKNVEMGATGVISILASPPVELWSVLCNLIDKSGASTNIHYEPYRADGDPLQIGAERGQSVCARVDQEFTGSVYIPHPYISNVVHWYKELA